MRGKEGLASILEREFIPDCICKSGLHMQLEEEDGRKKSDNIYTKTFKSENGNETCIHNRTNI